MSKPTFSFSRYLTFQQKEFSAALQKVWMVVVGLFLLAVTLNFLQHVFFHSANTAIIGLFWSSLFIVGMSIVSNASKKTATVRTGSFYYMLPVSIFEKFLSRFMLTGPLFFLAISVLAVLAAIVSNALLKAFSYPVLPSLSSLISDIKMAIGPFFILHASFFCVSHLFKKNTFGRSYLFIQGVFGLALILTIVFLYFIASFSVLPFQFAENLGDFLKMWLSLNPLTMPNRIVTYGILMPLLWFTAFRLFKEREL